MFSAVPGGHAWKGFPVGLGLAALGRPGYINLGHAQDLQHEYDVAAMERRAHEVLDAAYGAGIRYFDAARSYGRAEFFLQSWLASRVDLTDLIIGSKWGYQYTAEWQVEAEVHEQKEHSVERLTRQWNESRSILGSHLNLYQIHSATLESGVLDNREVLEKLAEIQQLGVLIGLSVSGPAQAAVIQKAREVVLNGVRVFDAVQATWNLLEPSATEQLQQAHDAGMIVIIKESLANGRLTYRNPQFVKEPVWRAVQSEADRLQVSIDTLALANVIQQPWVSIVLSGASTLDQLQSNLTALSLLEENIPSDLLADLVESPEEYWSKRSQLKWN